MTRRVLLPSPLPHQLDVLLAPARHKVVVCGRRWGKTLLGLLACLEGHGPKRGGYPGALEGAAIWWIAPSFPIGTQIWNDLKHALRGAWLDKHEKQWRIDLPGGGSVTVKSADNPDALRGVGLDGVVLDEAAFMSEAAWINGIRPALADRQGWAMFLTTPNGMNWFHGLFEAAETRPGWLRWQRPTSENPKIPREELVAAREDMGELTFRQEHLAEFVIAGAGLFKPEWLEACYDVIHGTRYRLPDGELFERSDLTRFSVCDLAVSTKTTADYTVIGTFGITPSKRLLVLEIDRKRREGPQIIPAIQGALERWNADVAWIERSGFQLALLQEARSRGLPVRELQPDRDKVSRAMPATAAFEGGRILLPRAASWRKNLRTELLSFPEGRHDDQVDVISYAVQILNGLHASQPRLSFFRK